MTADGGMYVWGQGDGGWLGLPPPFDLPILGEGDLPILPVTSSSSCTASGSSMKGAGGKRDQVTQKQEIITQSCSFDSKHNVLVPVRINKYLVSSQYGVEKVRCGGSHSVIFLASKREEDCQTEDEMDVECSPHTSNGSTRSSSNSEKGGCKVDSLVGSKRSPPSHAKDLKSSEPKSLTMAEFLASSKM